MHVTKGGKRGHLLRRLIHISIIFIPIFYYFFAKPSFSSHALTYFLSFFIVTVLLFEWIRIKYRIVFFAQRAHEANQFSAFGWTMISIALVLLLSPTPQFAFPIIFNCALADPVMGEMRMRSISPYFVFLAGLCVVGLVWFFFANLNGFSYYYLCLAPLIVAVEFPTLKWIDDNALMMLVPLVVVCIAAH